MTNFTPFQTEFADYKFRFVENGRKFCKEVENTVGKAAISDFFPMFSKRFIPQTRKTRACLGKGSDAFKFRSCL